MPRIGITGHSNLTHATESGVRGLRNLLQNTPSELIGSASFSLPVAPISSSLGRTGRRELASGCLARF